MRLIGEVKSNLVGNAKGTIMVIGREIPIRIKTTVKVAGNVMNNSETNVSFPNTCSGMVKTDNQYS